MSSAASTSKSYEVNGSKAHSKPKVQQFTYEPDTLGYGRTTGIVTFQVKTSSNNTKTVKAAVTEFLASNGAKVTVTARKADDGCWGVRPLKKACIWLEKVNLYFECKSKGVSLNEIEQIKLVRETLLSDAQAQVGKVKSTEQFYVDSEFPDLPDENKAELVKLMQDTPKVRCTSMYAPQITPAQKRLELHMKNLRLISGDDKKLAQLIALNNAVKNDQDYCFSNRICPICNMPLENNNPVMVKYKDPLNGQDKYMLVSKQGATKIIADKVEVGAKPKPKPESAPKPASSSKQTTQLFIDGSTIEFMPLPTTQAGFKKYLAPNNDKAKAHIEYQVKLKNARAIMNAVTEPKIQEAKSLLANLESLNEGYQKLKRQGARIDHMTVINVTELRQTLNKHVEEIKSVMEASYTLSRDIDETKIDSDSDSEVNKGIVDKVLGTMQQTQETSENKLEEFIKDLRSISKKAADSQKRMYEELTAWPSDASKRDLRGIFHSLDDPTS